MSRNLQRSIRSLNVMRSHSAKLDRLVDLVNSSGLTGAIRQMEIQQAAITRALSLADYTARYADLIESATRLHELSLQPLTSIQTTLDRIHRSWLELSNIESAIQTAEMAKIALTDVSHYLATSELLRDGIDYDALARALNVQHKIMSKVEESTKLS